VGHAKLPLNAGRMPGAADGSGARRRYRRQNNSGPRRKRWIVAINKDGGLVVADDVGNTIWRITPAGATAGN
jgi:hypothetical protein